MCHTDDVSSGRSPDRHQASWELCVKEGRTSDAHHWEGKFVSRFMHRNVLEIYENRCQITPNGSQFGRWCALGSFRGSKITQKLPKAPPKGPQGDPRAPFGSPRGVPRATKSSQRAPRGSPRALLGGLGRGKIRKKSTLAKVLRDSPLPMRGALWTPPNTSNIDPECSKLGS